MLKAANLTGTSTAPLSTAGERKYVDRGAQLRKLARAGRQWKMTVGRKVDMESK